MHVCSHFWAWGPSPCLTSAAFGDYWLQTLNILLCQRNLSRLRLVHKLRVEKMLGMSSDFFNPF